MPSLVGAPLETEDQDKERRLREWIADSGALANGVIMLALEAESRLIGEVQARQPEHALPPGVFEIGIEIYREADRGKGYGAEAIAVFTSHLFEERGAHRVQASTDVGNRAMRRVLERLGFPLEGVLRGFMPGTDGPRDYAMYGMTKRDWEKTRTEWIHRS